jgi:hypothetical protein
MFIKNILQRLSSHRSAAGSAIDASPDMTEKTGAAAGTAERFSNYTRRKKTLLIWLLVLTVLFAITISFVYYPLLRAAGETIEWDSSNGGGGTSYDVPATPTKVLRSSIGQVVAGRRATTPYLIDGYQIAIPIKPLATCAIGGAACSGATCYGAADAPFKFTNTAGCAGPAACGFNRGATQYYQYLWQTSSTVNNTNIQNGASWGDSNTLCPGASCGFLQTTSPNDVISLTPPATTNTAYLVVRSYNGGQCAGTTPTCDGLIGGNLVLGPYQYDADGASIAGTLAISNTDYANTYVDGTFDISLGSITSVGCSAISSCKYTTDNGSNWYNASYSLGTCSISGATCTNAASLTIKMKVIDGRANETQSSSVARTCDTQAPSNPTVAGYDSSGMSVTLTTGNSYGYTGPTGPYFVWTAPSDNLSGVAGYYVYFGSNASADPSSYQTGLNYTNAATLTSGSTYYLRIKTVDNVGNVSAAQTLFTYNYTGGGYLRVTENDTDGTTYGGTDTGATDNPDGILNPNGTDFEIVLVQLYDEWDNLATNPPLSTKSVTVSLGNIGATGAYISATNLGGATVGGASVTGTLLGGWAWIKVKAAAVQNDAITVSATATGLSGTGGSNQTAYILLRTATGVQEPVYTITPAPGANPAGDTVMHPVWSHNGKNIAFCMRAASPYDGWNAYTIHWNGTGWDTAVRLTNNGMKVMANGRLTFSGDDDKVIFVAYSTQADAYAVKTDGTDKDKTLANLASENKKISNGAGNYFWWGADWNRTDCTNGYQDRMLVSLADSRASKPTMDGMEIYMLHGAKNAANLLTEASTSFTYTTDQVTQIGGAGDYYSWAMQPSWSSDCSKIVFISWTSGYYGEPSAMGVYIINLTDASFGAVVPSLPITSLTGTGVYTVQQCDDALTCPHGSALYPTFTNDGTMVSYMADPNMTFDFNVLVLDSLLGTSIADNFFNGENFDNYVEYIRDGATFSPQLIGQSTNNEFGLVQCFGTGCPNSTNGNMFSYVTQKTGSTNGQLSFLELSNDSTITQNGGLMFYQGAVTAVIPPGAIDANEIQLSVTTPAPATSDGDDLLVSTGEAREFFPNGVKFGKDIRMIIHYCDADNNGYLDTVQNATCTGSGGSIDENSLKVYYWCEVGNSVGCDPGTSGQWTLLTGSIDPTNNYITVAINHFSRYDVFALSRGGIAPAQVVMLDLVDLHTYPNPWRTGQNNIMFTASESKSTYNSIRGYVTMDIEIYDIRGKLVRRILKPNVTTPIQSSPAAFDDLILADWDVRNNSGSKVASGVYMYILKVTDGVWRKTYKGKLAVVR